MKKECDVLICGAGISGLYFAWRLLNSESFIEQRAKGKSPKVSIVELSNRIGGRIETVGLDADSELLVELGAMRYLSNHKLVHEVVSKLALQTTPFFESHRRSYFLRGQHITADELSREAGRIYNLKKDETGLSPIELLSLALGRLNGEALSDPAVPSIGFANALKNVVSHEASLFLKDSFGYDSNFVNCHLAEGIKALSENFLDTHAGYTIVGGMSKLTERLASEVVRLGGSIYLNTRLVGFDAKKNSLEDTAVDAYLQTQSGGEAIRVHAKNLVLAMPQRSLELISQRSPCFALPAVRESLASVQAQAAFKLFLSYDRCWWDEKKFGSDGLVLSDQPLRMNYHKKLGQKALVMVYSDMDPDSYWCDLYPKDFMEMTLLGGQRASTAMIQTVHARLADIYSVKSLPNPTHSMLRDWSADPFGGGYHVWRPHCDVAQISAFVRRPLSDQPVFICGEAYSNCQSWIEGAMRSAESILQEHFHLNPLIQQGSEKKAA